MEVGGDDVMTPIMEWPGHGGEEEEDASTANKVSSSRPYKRKSNKSGVWDHYSRIINEKIKKTNKVKCIHLLWE